MIVINKSDMLSETARVTWTKYFRDKGIKFAFFSAVAEQIKLDLEAKLIREEANAELQDQRNFQSSDIAQEFDSDSSGSPRNSVDKSVPNDAVSDIKLDDSSHIRQNVFCDDHSTPRILSKSELLQCFARVYQESNASRLLLDDSPSSQMSSSSNLPNSSIPPSASNSSNPSNTSRPSNPTNPPNSPDPLDSSAPSQSIIVQSESKSTNESSQPDRASQSSQQDTRRITVGMVGYPNVGKSSIINVLVGTKKVAVAATPGKTKHFQTLNINDNIQVRVVECRTNTGFLFSVCSVISGVGAAGGGRVLAGI